VPLLSDWNGDVARAFGVAFDARGMRDVPGRASFLVEEGSRIRQSWNHGGDLPDLDVVIAEARGLA
jgi:peroxiredoxin